MLPEPNPELLLHDHFVDFEVLGVPPAILRRCAAPLGHPCVVDASSLIVRPHCKLHAAIFALPAFQFALPLTSRHTGGEPPLDRRGSRCALSMCVMPFVLSLRQHNAVNPQKISRIVLSYQGGEHAGGFTSSQVGRLACILVLYQDPPMKPHQLLRLPK